MQDNEQLKRADTDEQRKLADELQAKLNDAESEHRSFECGWNLIRATITALRATPGRDDVPWLHQGDAQAELKRAIDNAFGPPGDDKPILAELRKQGVWLARFETLTPDTGETK